MQHIIQQHEYRCPYLIISSISIFSASTINNSFFNNSRYRCNRNQDYSVFCITIICAYHRIRRYFYQNFDNFLKFIHSLMCIHKENILYSIFMYHLPPYCTIHSLNRLTRRSSYCHLYHF